MTCANYRRALALGLLLFFAVQALAQVTESQPIRVETRKPKKEKFQGEVLSITRAAITVRSRDNFNLVRVFTYDQKLAARMGKWVDRDQFFQHGDRVQIEFLAGTDKAVKIEGKPSQPRNNSGPSR